VTHKIILRHALSHLERHFVRVLRTELNGGRLTVPRVIRRLRYDVQDDVMRDTKWSWVSFKFIRRSCDRP